MKNVFLKSVAGLGLSLLACAANANLVTNGNFATCTGTAVQTNPSDNKTNFASCAPTDWTGGTGLVYVDAPGTADGSGYLSVYGPFPSTSPVGGNFVQSDGNPIYNSAFSQVVNGLTAGDSYTLSFYQAAGQQTTFTGATTEQWKVSLGGQTQSSTLMSDPSEGVVGWQQDILTFTATAASETLSFLAWGDGGNTTNLPPMVFLAGVDLEQVPEPATIALVGIALFGIGAIRMRQSGRNTTKG